MRGLAAMGAPRCARAATSRAEGLCHAVHCETQEEPFERPLSDLVVDLCSPLFLEDCVAVNPQDVVDTADSQTLPKEGELCLRIVAELNVLVHCTDDVCLVRSCSGTNCRETTATPSAMLPSGTAEVLAKPRTSPIFHPSGAASRSFSW